MSTLTSKAFWTATGERIIRTAAQAAIASIGTTALIHQVDWVVVGSTTAMAAVLALLMAIGADAATGTGPALMSAETVTQRGRYADRDGTLDGKVTPHE